MNLGVKCARCGYLNDLQRLFCSRCGVKLDMSAVARRLEIARRPSVASGLASLLRFVVVLLLLVGIGFLLWPVTPTGEKGSAADAQQVSEK